HDGLGLKLLQRNGVDIAIITTCRSNMIAKRCEHLGIKHLYQGHENKMVPYQTLQNEFDLTPQQIAYVGDDLPDLPLIQLSGLGIAPANAVDIVRKNADYVTQSSGGQGAVREVCELILQAQGKWEKIIEDSVIARSGYEKLM